MLVRFLNASAGQGAFVRVTCAQWFKDDGVLLLRGRMIANIDVVYRQQVDAALNGLADDAVVSCMKLGHSSPTLLVQYFKRLTGY